MTAVAAPSHPARFSQAILEHLAGELRIDRAHRFLSRPLRVLDPFAGVGGIHHLADMVEGIDTVGVELEPEWAAADPRTLVGDARHLPFPRRSFDAVVTSPAYGNRMADQYDGRDGSRRHTYRIALGRELSPGSGAALQWGKSYRSLHRVAWMEARRVLRPGGLFLLNGKNHVRAGHEQRVVEWHMGVLAGLGFRLSHVQVIPTAGLADGANHDLRVEGERVVTFRKVDA